MTKRSSMEPIPDETLMATNLLFVTSIILESAEKIARAKFLITIMSQIEQSS